jgi:hypothetical protein
MILPNMPTPFLTSQTNVAERTDALSSPTPMPSRIALNANALVIDEANA